MTRWTVTAWTEDLTDPEVSVVAENEDAALELGKAQLPLTNDYSIAKESDTDYCVVGKVVATK